MVELKTAFLKIPSAMLQPYIHLFFLLNLCLYAESGVHACNDRCARCDEGKCIECRYGWLGHQCNDKCNNCWITGCEKHTGKCIQCRPGRYKEDCGTLCPDTCKPDRDGAVYCRRKDGKCLDGCKKGRWGDTCSKTCKHCVTGSCLQNNGHCIGDCEVGWHRPGCDRICSNGCRNNKCHWMNGKCTDGCLKSLYGNKCTKDCSTNCDDSECDMFGWCRRGCIAGFRGKTCNETCPFNCLKCEQTGDTCTECKTRRSGKQCQHHMDEVYAEDEEARSGDADSQAKVAVDVPQNQNEKNGGESRCDLPMFTLFICILLSSFWKYILLHTNC